MKNLTFHFLLVLAFLMCACAKQNNVTDRNKSLVITANDELFNKGNLSIADEIFDSDYAGEGPERIKNFVSELRTAFPDLQVSIDPIIAEGNMTAWQRTHTGTHKGEYMGFQPTGNNITWKTIIFTEYSEEGVIQKEWAVSNQFEVLQKQLVGE